LKPLQLVAAMHDSIKAIKTVRFKVSAVERIQDTYSKVVSENKIQTKPRKLYLVNLEKKLEILYVDGLHNNKAVVKPHVFPYLTLILNPQGSLMRKNQHYSINELGFDFIGQAINLALSKEKDNMAKSITYHGMQTKNGYKCHLFVYEAKTFPYTEYTVQEKEMVSTIAAKFHVNDYIIRAKNNLYNEFGNLKVGTKILVPIYYCKKAVFYLDEKTLLPVSVSVFDDRGLLENYDFTNIILNKPIPSEEFTEGYKDYHF
jgi:LysM repeat protein